LPSMHSRPAQKMRKRKEKKKNAFWSHAMRALASCEKTNSFTQ
jgi:hypothetical protein